MDIDKFILMEDIKNIMNNFKDKCLIIDKTTENDLIITCLNNNHDYRMIEQLNLVTYSGPQYKDNYTLQ